MEIKTLTNRNNGQVYLNKVDLIKYLRESRNRFRDLKEHDQAQFCQNLIEKLATI